MFKVSLLPESYRKKLIGKKNKDIILSVALVVLMCMLIVYAGVAVRFLILKNQAKEVSKQNAKMMEKIAELSPYVDNYNALAEAEANLKNIKPVDINVLEMINIVQDLTPDYIDITAIYAPDWQNKQAMVIEGDFSAAGNREEATNMLHQYENCIKENAQLKDKIVGFKVVNDAPIVDTGSISGETTYSFRIIISLSSQITVDPQTGTLATVTTTESTTESTTAAAETDTTIAEANTIA